MKRFITMSKALYEERLNRINNAISLKESEMVPCEPFPMTFPYLFAGYTMKEVNYDIEKAKDSIRKYLNHFQPDMGMDFYAPLFGQ